MHVIFRRDAIRCMVCIRTKRLDGIRDDEERLPVVETKKRLGC